MPVKLIQSNRPQAAMCGTKCFITPCLDDSHPLSLSPKTEDLWHISDHTLVSCRQSVQNPELDSVEGSRTTISDGERTDEGEHLCKIVCVED